MNRGKLLSSETLMAAKGEAPMEIDAVHGEKRQEGQGHRQG